MSHSFFLFLSRNHFIISQANPHAVMFASYNHFRSIWSSPIIGFVNAVLTFLKDQCRSWLTHVVQLVGARRLAPQQSTSRGIGAQFFVQEYEGRDCDISLIPWLHHRSLLSALGHALYNPSENEFRSWVEAAQRETWKHIPAIRSHVAEEITLDRCVQRLRKRLVVESWTKRHKIDSTNAKMGDRVPSFFTSPSLVNFGGLAVTDGIHVEGLGEDDFVSNPDRTHQNVVHTNPASSLPSIPAPDIHPGWGGMGLRGNRNSGNHLERTSSDASGLFIEGDDHPMEQVAGEQTNHVPTSTSTSASPFTKKPTSTSSLEEPKYFKTTNMANFYYRNSASHQSLDKIGRSLSHGESNSKAKPSHTRNKSKSHTDLNWSS
jgi:hypothetical protein